jgi:hypothetical protein
VFPFSYKHALRHQCTYEELANTTQRKKWCCTNPDCDANLEWGECPEAKDVSPDSQNCTYGFTSADRGRNCYKVYSGARELRTWEEARKQCQNIDKAELVSIADTFEQSYVFLLTVVKTVSNSWIGLKNKGGSKWPWTDTNSLEYENWAYESDKSISKGQCAYIESKDGKWKFSSCGEKRAFICKISKDAPSKGLADSHIAGITVGVFALVVLSLIISLALLKHKKVISTRLPGIDAVLGKLRSGGKQSSDNTVNRYSKRKENDMPSMQNPTFDS